MHYFFLSSILPPLSLHARPSISFHQVLELCRANLSTPHLRCLNHLLRYVDLSNVKQLLLDRPIDIRGLLSKKDLEEALISREGLPESLLSHLQLYEEQSEQIRYFHQAVRGFIKDKRETEKGFLKRYFDFEFEWSLILAAYRSKRLGTDLTIELQHEDSQDPFVAGLLAQKNSGNLHFPESYERFGEELAKASGDPKREYVCITAERLQRIEGLGADSPFSISAILAYILCLMVIEDMWSLDEEEGEKRLLGCVHTN